MSLSLSKRLQFIAQQVSPSGVFADIGSDHAYLPCYVCLHYKDTQAIAGEVAKGPYEKSLETVSKYDLEGRVQVRLGDGLQVINTEDQVAEIIIAGMGGALISNILQEGKEKLQEVKRLILQPNNNEFKLRQTLLQLGFILTAEYILEENNLIYEILIAEHKDTSVSESPYHDEEQERQLFLGPYLSEERSPLFVKKWTEESKQLKKTIEQMKLSKDEAVQLKINKFKQRIKWIEEAIS